MPVLPEVLHVWPVEPVSQYSAVLSLFFFLETSVYTGLMENSRPITTKLSRKGSAEGPEFPSIPGVSQAAV